VIVRRGVARGIGAGLTLVASGALVLACSRPAREPVPEPVPLPPVEREISPWPGVLALAMRAVERARYEEADSVLTDFAVKHAGKAQGAEADYWRAVFKADPARTRITVREQLAAFDVYLAGGPTLPHYHEASIMRRMIEALDATRRDLVAARTAAETKEKAREDDIRKLTEDLERTMSELDRIRRRLVPPKP
jgi:hypothetical protein